VSHLLDTHAFLWWATDDTRLSETARDLIANRRGQIFLSVASVWEISIKHVIGKLPLATTLSRVVIEEPARNGFTSLPVTREHACRTGELPLLHRDPFDRLLVAQAQLEGLRVVTRDEHLRAYDVETIW